MVLANAMPHHHLWHSEPPEGKFTWSKSWDERYGDEEDMAANAMLTSPEETIRLRMELKKDPDYASSSNPTGLLLLNGVQFNSIGIFVCRSHVHHPQRQRYT